MKKILILFAIFIFISQQVTTQPTYTALPFVVTGKVDVLSFLITQAQGWVPYTVTFSKTLPVMAQIDASVSIISFDCFTSNEFSFNTSIKPLELTSMTISTKIYGNSYFRQLSLHYIVISHSEAISYIFNSCFLTSDLLGQKKSVTYNKIDLISTETNRFQTISFINGLKIYNNNQTVKYIHVQSYLKNAEKFIYHTISTEGKSLVEWICIGTFVMDAKYRATFSAHKGVYKYGKANINYNDPLLDWTQVSEFFNSGDMMFFGLSQIRLGSGKQNSKLLFHSERTTNFKQDTQVISFGGEVSYLFMANQQCLDPTTSYFNHMDWFCYDSCPNSTYNQDDPVKNCYPCHYSCQTCSGKQKSQCLTCQNTNMRILNLNQCTCNTGFVDVGVSICEKCSNFIDFCLQCDAIDNCKVCNFGLIFDPTSKKCVCSNNEYFVPLSSLCVPYPGCQEALNDGSLKCQTCNNSAYFFKDPNTSFCFCKQFYELKQGECIEKCGDGVNLKEDDLINCDDGNKINGDGCDSNCLIQPSYGCTNKINSISICSPLANFTLKYLYIQRIPQQNSAIIVIQVDPLIESMNSSDFKFTLQTSIPHQKITVYTVLQHSILKIKIDYLETIQDVKHELKIGFDKSKINTPDQVIHFHSQGVNLKLTYDSNIQLRKILNMITSILSGLILLVFIIFCFMQQKMAGTQLLLSCQLVYFTIFSVGNNAAIEGLNGLRYLTGFNEVYNFQVNLNNYQLFQILSTKVFKQYILNFNIMIAFQILSFLLIFPFKIIIWRLQKTKQSILNYELQGNVDENGQIKTVSQIRKKIYEAEITLKKYLNRFYYPFSLICLLPSIFYFSVQTFSTSTNNKLYLLPALNLLASCVSLILSCGFLVFLHQQSSKRRPMFTFFRKGIFYPFYLIFIYFAAVFVYSMALKYSLAFFIIVALQVGILVYRIKNKPYPRYGTIQAIDSLAKHFITIICMALLYTSKFFTQSAQMLFVAIPILLLINLSFTLVRYFKTAFLKKRKNSNQIDLLNKQNNQNQSQNDNQQDSQQQSSSQNFSEENKDLKNNKKTQQQASQEGQINQQAILQSVESEKNDFINSALNIPSDQENDDEDELIKIKRRLRKDLRQKRGIINSQAIQVKGKNRSNSLKI